MSEFAIVFLIVLFTATLPCLICGYLIAFKGRRSLISGWRDNKFSDPESASKVIGFSLILLALLLAIIIVFWWMQLIIESTLIYFIIPVSFIPILALGYVKIKFSVK